MKFIPNKVTRTFGRQILVMQKQSPHILFGVGVVGVLGSTVLACKATLKLGETLDEIKSKVDDVAKAEMPDKEHKKTLAYVYGTGTYDLVKLYAPAASVGIVSIALLTKSHVTLSRRNTALTAAYAGIAKSFDEYRDRVRAELGEKREMDIYQGASIVETTDPDTKKKTKERLVDPNALSQYAVLFDECNPNWKKIPEYNRMFIQAQQNYANHLLSARGHVFLNEIYDQIGAERTQAGSVVGWVRDGGDSYIDFGMFDARNKDFVNGYERSLWLDFNVDGIIYDKI